MPTKTKTPFSLFRKAKRLIRKKHSPKAIIRFLGIILSISAVLPVITLFAAGSPTTPTNLVFSNVTNSALTVSWTDADTGLNTPAFYIERAPDASGLPGTWAQVGTSNTLSYNDSGLSTNTKYFYRVRAQDNTLAYSSYSSGEINTDSGTTALWHMDEASGNVIDSSGNGNDGIGTSTVTTGAYGNARNFTSNKYVDLGNVLMNNPTAGTIEMWVRPAANGLANGGSPWLNTTFIAKGSSYFAIQQLASNKIRVYYDEATSTGVAKYFDSNSAIPINAWSHIAYSWDSTGSTIYINGVPDTRSPLTVTNIHADHLYTPFYIGLEPSNGYGFNGKIDEVRLSNVARTGIEIINDFNGASVYTSNIYSVSPNNGAVAGGTNITVAGTGFFPPNTGGGPGWTQPGTTTNGPMYSGSMVIVGSDLYTFGGYDGTSYSANIRHATTSSPTSWTAIGNMPGVQGWSQAAVVNGYVYLYGGINPTENSIVYSHTTADLLTNPSSGWTTTALPVVLGASQLQIIGSNIYLFGGESTGGNFTSAIYTASTSAPTTWTTAKRPDNVTAATLPANMAYTHTAVFGNYVYLFGGTTGSAAAATAITTVYRAAITDLGTWTAVGNLPFKLASSQLAVVGDTLYLIGGWTGTGGAATNVIYSISIANKILLGNMAAGDWISWTIPEALHSSQSAIINDGTNSYLYLFSGNNGTFTTKYYRTALTYFRPNVYEKSWLTNWPTIPSDQSNVTIGGTSATNIQYVNGNSITATTPAHSGGNVDVAVIKYDGTSAPRSNGYAFGAPTITSINPTSGILVGGTNVTITGTDFAALTTVSFAGTPATNVNVVDSTHITATTPAHLFGGYTDVLVTKADGTAGTLTNGFFYSSQQITNNMNASDLIGQYNGLTPDTGNNFTSLQVTTTPNNVGMESPNGNAAIDTVNHRLFIPDQNNNRVFVYNMTTSNILADKTPDFVLGQSSFFTKTAAIAQTGMSFPSFAAFDSVNNRLFVSDQGSNRILVFNTTTITNGMAASNVLGQANFTSGSANTTPTQSGLASPKGLAYDPVNNRLFAIDYSNQRILIYNTASITNGMAAANVLGQPSFSARIPNNTNATFGCNTGFNACGVNAPIDLNLDSSGNRLFVADQSNNRVLVFNTSSISNGMNASFVLGQAGFTTGAAATTQAGMNLPQSVAYDSVNNRLFVSEWNNNRVLAFNTTTISNGMNAANVLGQANFTTGTAAKSQTGLNNPIGLSIDNTSHKLYINNYASNSFLIQDITANPITNNQPASGVIGQSNYTNYLPGGFPNENYLKGPSSSALDTVNHRFYVHDSKSGRVLVYALDSSNNFISKVPTNVIGQVDFATSSSTINSSTIAPEVDPATAAVSGIAVDTANNRLFVTDTNNSRVLVFNTTTITNGMAATNVLGQGGFTTGASATTQAGLQKPAGLAYDSVNNRLFVADFMNRRVLVYSTASITNGMVASYVLGQPNFTTNTNAAPTQINMNLPNGITYDSVNNRLFVVDQNNKRILVFNTSTITNGMNASYVLGEPNFTTGNYVTTQAGTSYPSGAVYDAANNQLFVADHYNSRVLVYNTSTITNGMNASYVLGQPNFTTADPNISQKGFIYPMGLSFNPINNTLYVADLNNNRIVIFSFSSAPTISSLSPSVGTGGDTITITGTNFVSGATVTLGGASAPTVNVVDSNHLSIILPSHASGPVDVVVTNLDGQSGTLNGGFSYTGTPGQPLNLATSQPPQPASGQINLSWAYPSIDGGSAISDYVIQWSPDGSNWTTVNDGVNTTASLSVTGLTNGTAYQFRVAAVNVFGQGDWTSSVAGTPSWKPIAPTGLTGTTPSAGQVNLSWTAPTDNGGLTSTYTVRYGIASSCTSPATSASGCDETNNNILYSTTTKVLTGLNSGTSYNFAVYAVNANGSGTVSNVYTVSPTYPAPTVSAISPTGGSTAGGTAVTITGTNFRTGTAISLGGASASGITVVSATSITATTPAHAVGAVDVVVTNPDSLTATLSSGYTYSNPPTIASISPTAGAVAGGTSVTITGTYFVTGATVKFGTTAATGVTVTNSTTITATTPAHAGGNTDVVVTNPDTQVATLTGGYIFLDVPTNLTAVPGNGTVGLSWTAPAGSGLTYVVEQRTPPNTGTYSQVTLADSTATSAAVTGLTVGNSYEFRVKAVSGSGNSAFTNPVVAYLDYTSALSTVSPASGLTTGGGSMTIRGTNLVPSVNGNGADGSVTIASNKTLDGTQMATGRTCADAINYSVTGLTANTATLSTSPTAACLYAGDEVLLISLEGNSTFYSNVGNYETLRIQSISGSTITFTKNKTKYYGTGAANDSGITTSPGNQHVMLQRVPNYTNVTINSGITLSTTAWNGLKGGVLFFRANGTLINNGTISENASGYAAVLSGSLYSEGIQGLGYGGANGGTGGTGTQSPSTGGGGGGGGGGSGGYGTAGGGGGGGGAGGHYGSVATYPTGPWQPGGNSSGTTGGSAGSPTEVTQGPGGTGGNGASTYGQTNLSQLFLGTSGGNGGGGGSAIYSGTFAGAPAAVNGGSGGGIIMIMANQINTIGAIRSTGGNGAAGSQPALTGVGRSAGGGSGAGGAGSGGSILIGSSNTIALGSNNVTAAGGTIGLGGDGGCNISCNATRGLGANNGAGGGIGGSGGQEGGNGGSGTGGGVGRVAIFAPTITGAAAPSAYTANSAGLPTVRFGSISATNVQYVDANTITATIPAGVSGATDVNVTSSAGQTYTLTGGYTYYPAGSTVPGSPTTLGTSTGGHQVVLSWTAPGNTGGISLSGYTVRYGLASDSGCVLTTAGAAGCTEITGISAGTLSSTVTGLTNGSSYKFTVFAVNAVGNSTAAIQTTGTPGAAPNAPASLSAQAGSSGGITLTWNAPTDNGGFTVSDYILQYKKTSDSTFTTLDLASTSTSTVMNGLVRNQSYVFQVAAVNSIGTSSYSSQSSATPSFAGDDCSAVENLDSTLGTHVQSFTTVGYTDDGLTGIWTQYPDHISEIQVPAHSVLNIFPSQIGGSSVSDSTIYNNHWASYHRIAVATAGSCVNGSAAGTTIASPDVLTSTRPNAYYNTDFDNYTYVNNSNSTKGIYWVMTGFLGSTGTYDLTWTVSQQPTGLQTTQSSWNSTGNNSMVLSWNQAGGTVLDYMVEYRPYPFTASYTVVDTGSTATSYTLTGLADTPYQMRVRAQTGAGTYGTYSDVLTYNPGEDCFNPDTLVDSPAGVTHSFTGSTVGYNSDLLSTGYLENYLSLMGSGPDRMQQVTVPAYSVLTIGQSTRYDGLITRIAVGDTCINNSQAGSSITSPDRLTPEQDGGPNGVDQSGTTNFSYFNGSSSPKNIYWINSELHGYNPGDYAFNWSITPPTAPAAPASLTATAGDTLVHLSWQAPDDGGAPITAYTVHYSSDGFVHEQTTNVAASNTSTNITGLTNGTTYQFKVVATTVAGDSGDSNTATAQPRFAAPTISNINPSGGRSSGGETVTITGANFRSGVSVQIGGQSVSSDMTDSSHISFTAPAHASGAADVVVTNSDNQSGTATGGYHFYDAPTVSAVNPPYATVAGGSSVSVTGTNFRSGETATIGGVSATTSYINSTTLSVTVPAGLDLGDHVIEVTAPTPDLQSAALAADQFTIYPTGPIQVVNLPGAANTKYTLGAVQTQSVAFNKPLTSNGKADAEAAISASSDHSLSFTWNNRNTIMTVHSGNSASGFDNNVYAVALDDVFSTTTDNVQVIKSIPKVYQSEIATSVSLESGVTEAVVNQSIPATITIPATTTAPTLNVKPLYIDGTATLPGMQIDRSTDNGAVHVTIPDGASVRSHSTWDGTLDVTQELQSTAVKPLIPVPTRGLISNVSGFRMGKANNTLMFQKAVRLEFDGLGGKSAGFIQENGTFHAITTNCAVDTQSANDNLPTPQVDVNGNVSDYSECKIRVGTNNADLVIWTKHFTDFVFYDAELPPTVSGVTPDYANAAGGDTVIISGSNFGTGATVYFGAAQSPSVTVDSGTQITATAPAHARGAVSVIVTNTNALSGTLTNGLSYFALPGSPRTLAATAGNTEISLSWVAPLDNGGTAVTAYQVRYRLNPAGAWTEMAPVNVATDTITGLTNGVVYDFQVAAINEIGTGVFSSSFSSTPTDGSTPPPPVNGGNSQANLNIGCNSNGTLSISTPSSISFEGKSVNFYSDTDASALSDTARVRVTDTRGYDPDITNCGAGFSLSVQSSGLRYTDDDGSGYNLQIGLGAVNDNKFTEDNALPISSPDNLVGNIVHADTLSSDTLITNSAVLVSADEAFTGDVEFGLDAGFLKTVHNALQTFTSNPLDTPSNYSGYIPRGDYTGVITFTLS